MRIAHISPTYGGVGTAAARLHNGLVKIGVDSSLFTTHRFGPNSDLPQVYPMPPANRLLRYADILSKMIDNRFGLTGMTHVSSLFHSYPEFDVIHLHGADSNWFNMNALRRLGRNRVLVWTMHDKH
ncbi:MAG TPA: glycosyltransferase, partial [Nitrospiraceae bacterium]